METEQMRDVAGGGIRVTPGSNRPPVRLTTHEQIVQDLEQQVSQQRARAVLAEQYAQQWEAAADIVSEDLRVARGLINDLAAEKAELVKVVRAMDSGWAPPRAWPPELVEAMTAIGEEFFRAKAKHGDKCIDGPDYSDGQRLAILMEEVGEVAHELTYDAPGQKTRQTGGGALGAELTQVGAMAAGWLLGVQRALSQPQTAQKDAPATQGGGNGFSGFLDGLARFVEWGSKVVPDDNGLWAPIPVAKKKACCVRGLQAYPDPCPIHQAISRNEPV